MKIYDLSTHQLCGERIPEQLPGAGLFVLCRAGEVRALGARFGWDEATCADCLNLDEAVRYTGYDRYDFVSLIHMEPGRGALWQREINLFFSRQYLVLVLPEQAGARLEKLEAALCRAAERIEPRQSPLAWLYHLVLSHLAADFSDSLETLEDELEALSETVAQSPRQNQAQELDRLRRAAYTAQKLLRALSYIGEEIVMDENGLLDKGQLRYFRNIDTRLKKLYDFADNLYRLCGEIQQAYDSRLAMKMNELVNKLTVITLFFGPLTVITGIYGMNFAFMPELKSPAGYPLALGGMAAVSLIIYLILKKKRWL